MRTSLATCLSFFLAFTTTTLATPTPTPLDNAAAVSIVHNAIPRFNNPDALLHPRFEIESRGSHGGDEGGGDSGGSGDDDGDGSSSGSGSSGIGSGSSAGSINSDQNHVSGAWAVIPPVMGFGIVGAVVVGSLVW